MEHQIDNVISILSTLMTGGFLIILIETLHLSNIISERFYCTMKPFEKRFVSYVCCVKSIGGNIEYLDCEEEHVKVFKKLINKVLNINEHKSIYSSFTAIGLDSLCETTINGIWYYLSEKGLCESNCIRYSEASPFLNKGIKKHLYALSPKYKKLQPSLNTLMLISGDFYIEIYKPISDVYFEFEYWKKRMRIMNIISFSYTSLLTVFLLLIAFLYTMLNIYFCYIVTFIFSISFLLIIYNFINIYKESIERLKQSFKLE